MKIKNPGFQTTLEKKLTFLEGTIGVFIASLPETDEFIDFDVIRQMVVDQNIADANGVIITGDDLTDGVISEIAQRNNVEVLE